MTTDSYRGPGGPRSIDVARPGGGGAAPRPAVLLFHGGAWRFGDRAQFRPQCERLAAAGFVAATADYRLDGTILDCVLDARAAFDHLVHQAPAWGIDPTRIAVGGGSAGGHLAACLGTCPDVRPAAAPAALVLFNPVLAFAGALEALGELAPDVGTGPDRLSPVDQDLAGLAPTVIFHGTADSLVPIASARQFRDRALEAGSRCELHEFEGREHAFFNPVPPELAELPNAGDFDTTTDRSIEFLAEVLAAPTAPAHD